MRIVGQDQLIFHEAKGRVEYELVEPDKSYVTRFSDIITFLSHDVKVKISIVITPTEFVNPANGITSANSS